VIEQALPRISHNEERREGRDVIWVENKTGRTYRAGFTHHTTLQGCRRKRSGDSCPGKDLELELQFVVSWKTEKR
jgi:hypothetical protein